MELLKTTHYLDGRVHILHDLSDTDLNTLYGACLFTTFPSFVEGWGLPVGESLARGKPCVASSTSSLPEVGGDLVDYVDPLNLRDGIPVLHRMIFDDDYRERRSANIQTRFKPRNWSDMATDLLHQVDRIHRQSSANPTVDVLFPVGSIFRPGDLALGRKLPKNYACHPWRMMLVDSWQKPEFEGCWMKGTKSSLTFKSDLPAGTGIVAYFRINGAPWASPQHRLLITIGDHPETIDLQALKRFGVPILPKEQFSVRVEGYVGDDSVVTIMFTTSEKTDHNGEENMEQSVLVNLAVVGYTVHSSGQEHSEFLEKLFMVI